MNILFDSPQKITFIESQSVIADSIRVVRVIDNYKTVVAVISTTDDSVVSPEFNISLWEGEAYTKIGQWTDTDVKNRLLELL